MRVQSMVANDFQVYSSDIDLMARVLEPYKTHCRYLINSKVVDNGDPLYGGRVLGLCDFSIPESCYIDDTGHFNAVEFNICYNQMMYYVVAKSVKERLMSSFDSWSLGDYWRKQLPDIYIVNFESAFKKSMKALSFSGEIEFTKVRKMKDLPYINTTCRFWDESGGNSSGKVTLAIV